jgi:octopine/nopaline transport system permease protein
LIEQASYFDLVGFGPMGWGSALILAAARTIFVASGGFTLGSVIGILIASAKLSRLRVHRGIADAYMTVLRGVPDLLVIYLLYFQGSKALTSIGSAFGESGFISVPPFAAGVAALGVISGAFQAQLFQGAYRRLSKGELEAGRSFGMSRWTLLRRIIVPQAMRYALPGLGNIWQVALKESSLISVVGLVEILRQSQIAAGATYRPFDFYITALFLYLAITTASNHIFKVLENRSMRGLRKAV